MAGTDEILDAARKLGRMISENDAAKKFEAVLKKLNEDTEAQRVLNDYNRHLQAIALKEQQGQPIEVDEKHKLQELKKGMAANSLLGELQLAQMDYLDLMRRVDEAMSSDQPAAVAPDTGGSPTGGSATGQ